MRARFAEEIDGLAAEGSEAARAALAASLVPPLRRHAVEVVREGVGREVHSLRHRLGRTFDRAFRYDEGGLPRAWAPDDDVKGAWAKAKKAALTQLHLFGEAAAAEACGGDAPLAAALAAELKEAVDDEAAAAFESAKAAQAATAAAAAADVGVRRAPHPRRQRGDRHPLVELRPLAARARRDRRRRGGAQRARDADALRAPGVGANQRGGSREIAPEFKRSLH